MHRRVRDVRARGFVDGLEHLPRNVLVLGLAGNTVHDEDALDGFGAQDIAGVA